MCLLLVLEESLRGGRGFKGGPQSQGSALCVRCGHSVDVNIAPASRRFTQALKSCDEVNKRSWERSGSVRRSLAPA